MTCQHQKFRLHALNLLTMGMFARETIAKDMEFLVKKVETKIRCKEGSYSFQRAVNFLILDNASWHINHLA